VLLLLVLLGLLLLLLPLRRFRQERAPAFSWGRVERATSAPLATRTCARSTCHALLSKKERR
jgi:hypothetical protein